MAIHEGDIIPLEPSAHESIQGNPFVMTIGLRTAAKWDQCNYKQALNDDPEVYHPTYATQIFRRPAEAAQKTTWVTEWQKRWSAPPPPGAPPRGTSDGVQLLDDAGANLMKKGFPIIAKLRQPDKRKDCVWPGGQDVTLKAVFGYKWTNAFVGSSESAPKTVTFTLPFGQTSASITDQANAPPTPPPNAAPYGPACGPLPIEAKVEVTLDADGCPSGVRLIGTLSSSCVTNPGTQFLFRGCNEFAAGAGVQCDWSGTNPASGDGTFEQYTLFVGKQV